MIPEAIASEFQHHWDCKESVFEQCDSVGKASRREALLLTADRGGLWMDKQGQGRIDHNYGWNWER